MGFKSHISLAQAQECILEKSILDARKPLIISKVSLKYLYMTNINIVNISWSWNVKVLLALYILVRKYVLMFFISFQYSYLDFIFIMFMFKTTTATKHGRTLFTKKINNMMDKSDSGIPRSLSEYFQVGYPDVLLVR